MWPEQHVKLRRGEQFFEKLQTALPATVVHFNQLPRVLVFRHPAKDLQEFLTFNARQVLEFRKNKIRAA